MENYKRLLASVVDIARQAGALILHYHEHRELLSVKKKSDGTPLTVADLEAQKIIMQGLKKLTPNVPLLSEEGEIPSYSVRQHWLSYWLIDPLDGTKGFIRGGGEITINIALIHNHAPIIGVIYAPVFSYCYYAAREIGVSFQYRNNLPIKIKTTVIDWHSVRVMMGQFHRSRRLFTFLENLKNFDILHINSSIKFAKIAAGESDLYLRYGSTGEWDTAAGQCILEEAGGLLVDLNGEPLRYNCKKSLINPAFLAIGDPTQLRQALNFLPT